MPKWALQVRTDDTGTWYSNALRWNTREEAEEYGEGLFHRWSAVREWRAVPVTELDSRKERPQQVN